MDQMKSLHNVDSSAFRAEKKLDVKRDIYFEFLQIRGENICWNWSLI